MSTTENYHVMWEIDIDAETPEAAAREAFKCMQDPQTTATVFDVFDEDGTPTRIDLAESDPVVKAEQEYLVILLYPEYMTDNYGQETYNASAFASSVAEAIASVRDSAVYENGGYDDNGIDIDPEDFYVIACINNAGKIVG